MKRIWIIFLGDLLSFLISFLLLIFFRYDNNTFLQEIDKHFIPFLIIYSCWTLVFYIFGLYDLSIIKPTIPYLKRWFFAIFFCWVLGILLFYFVTIFGISPKINLIFQILGFGFLSFFFRRIIYILFSKTITRPAILIGNSKYSSELEKVILKTPQTGLQIIGRYNKINELNLGFKKIKNLVIIIDKNIEIQNKDILDFYKKEVDILETEKAYEKYLFKIPVEYIDIMFLIENIKKRKDVLYKFLSFTTDKILPILILLTLSPLLIIFIIARLIEDGKPIFIKQKRVGLNNKIFNLYKLRSMIVLSPDGSAEIGEAKWSTGKNDPRVTPLGKIMRKLHIDEIPQMINIIKGDMSFVGPRPERPEFVEILDKKIPYYSFRHIINPGFTGWAQIKYIYANSIEDSKEKFEYDLYYIKNKNIFLDFGIILRTIQIIFTH